MKVYKLENTDSNSGYIMDDDTLGGLLDELKMSEVGDKYTVTILDMEKSEFDALPEFDGF